MLTLTAMEFNLFQNQISLALLWRVNLNFCVSMFDYLGLAIQKERLILMSV